MIQTQQLIQHRRLRSCLSFSPAPAPFPQPHHACSESKKKRPCFNKPSPKSDAKGPDLSKKACPFWLTSLLVAHCRSPSSRHGLGARHLSWTLFQLKLDITLFFFPSCDGFQLDLVGYWGTGGLPGVCRNCRGIRTCCFIAEHPPQASAAASNLTAFPPKTPFRNRNGRESSRCRPWGGFFGLCQTEDMGKEHHRSFSA